MSEAEQFYINVHEKDGHAIIHQLGPKDFHSAERIEMGLNRNLDHGQFYTEIVSVASFLKAKEK